MLQSHPRLRRSILIGTPLLTLLLLLFHPRPDPASMGLTEPLDGMDLYVLLAPVADHFLVVHGLFAPLLGLLGLSVYLLLDGQRGAAATLSRVSAFVFVVTYLIYETLAGTAAALLVRGTAGLPVESQAVLGEAVRRIYTDPIFGDLPSVVSSAAWLSWLLAVALAAVALRRSGRPLGPCLLLGLSFIFISHASMLGSLGMLLFLLAAVMLERAGGSAAARASNEVSPAAAAQAN